MRKEIVKLVVLLAGSFAIFGAKAEAEENQPDILGVQLGMSAGDVETILTDFAGSAQAVEATEDEVIPGAGKVIRFLFATATIPQEDGIATRETVAVHFSAETDRQRVVGMARLVEPDAGTGGGKADKLFRSAKGVGRSGGDLGLEVEEVRAGLYVKYGAAPSAIDERSGTIRWELGDDGAPVTLANRSGAGNNGHVRCEADFSIQPGRGGTEVETNVFFNPRCGTLIEARITPSAADPERAQALWLQVWDAQAVLADLDWRDAQRVQAAGEGEGMDGKAADQVGAGSKTARHRLRY